MECTGQGLGERTTPVVGMLADIPPFYGEDLTRKFNTWLRATIYRGYDENEIIEGIMENFGQRPFYTMGYHQSVWARYVQVAKNRQIRWHLCLKDKG